MKPNQTTACKPLKPFAHYRASAPAASNSSQPRMSTSAKTGVEKLTVSIDLSIRPQKFHLSRVCFLFLASLVWEVDSHRRYCICFSSGQQTRLSGLDNRCWETWGQPLERTSRAGGTRSSTVGSSTVLQPLLLGYSLNNAERSQPDHN